MIGADLDIDRHDAIVVVAIAGEVDMANADALRRAIEAGVAQDAEGAVIDLAAVSYIDSAGIHLLFGLAARLEQRGQRLCIVVPNGSLVEDALRHADALGELGASPTRDAAVEALAA